MLKEIHPEYSLEGLMLKLQHVGHLIRRADSLEKTLTLGKTEGGRRGRQRIRWLDGITHLRLDGHELEQTLEDGKDREAWPAVVHGVTMSRTQLSD